MRCEYRFTLARIALIVSLYIFLYFQLCIIYTSYTIFVPPSNDVDYKRYESERYRENHTNKRHRFQDIAFFFCLIKQNSEF